MAYEEFCNNPLGKRVGDCTVRAMSKALNLSWDDAYALLVMAGFAAKDMPSSDAVWGSVLKRHGFVKHAMPDSCPDCYTAEDFCHDHPDGVYVLGFGGHVATVINGTIYDCWNSSFEVPQFYWED